MFEFNIFGNSYKLLNKNHSLRNTVETMTDLWGLVPCWIEALFFSIREILKFKISWVFPNFLTELTEIFAITVKEL